MSFDENPFTCQGQKQDKKRKGFKFRTFSTLENERPCNRMFVMTTSFFLSFCLMSSDAKEHFFIIRPDSL